MNLAGSADDEYDCDLLIAGSGAAGLTAAITAHALGLRPMIIEKSGWIGGTTALSEGMIWVPLSRQAAAAGIADAAEKAVAYIGAAAGEYFDRPRATAYVHQAHSMLDFLETNSHVQFELVSGSMDYEPGLPGSLGGGRALRPGLFDARQLGPDIARLRTPLATTMIFGGMAIASADLSHFFALRTSWAARLHVLGLVGRYALDRMAGWPRGTRLGNGNGLIGSMMLTLRERGVPIITGARLASLNREAGRVTGAQVEQDGKQRVIRARAGVLLATGGFSADPALRAKYYAHVRAGKNHVLVAPESNTGDGLRAATDAGGTIGANLSNVAAWSPVSLVPQGDGTLVPFPHYLDRGKPGVIAVCLLGTRFVNEALCYHDFVQAMVRVSSDNDRVEAFLIADRRALRRYGLGVVPPSPGRITSYLRNGYLLCSDTLAGLGEQLGLPPGSLSDTVRRFNADAASGTDSEFGKGADPYQRASGDPGHWPNPCVAPLLCAPFYGVRVYPGDIATFVGLRTDDCARVTDANGDPIAGLYAAGNDMMSVMGGSYPAAGITVGSAMTFGYVAAKTAASAIL